MLDSKILQLKYYFGISTPEDWQDVEPAWILAQDGIGPVTLEHVRMYLAARGLTLKNDQTPEYWQKHLTAVKIGHTMGLDMDDGSIIDHGSLCPFTILIDSAEQQPFLFTGLRTDAEDGNRPIIVPTEFVCLGRHPDSMGDYSVKGFQGRIGIERKSMEDAQSTILGWDGRRERFECELQNLSRIEAALVVVECSFEQLIQEAPQFGARTKSQNAKSLMRSVLAFQQDYKVPWLFAGGRRLAEIATFRFIERFYRKQMEQRKKAEKEAARPRAAVEDGIAMLF